MAISRPSHKKLFSDMNTIGRGPAVSSRAEEENFVLMVALNDIIWDSPVCRGQAGHTPLLTLHYHPRRRAGGGRSVAERWQADCRAGTC